MRVGAERDAAELGAAATALAERALSLVICATRGAPVRGGGPHQLPRRGRRGRERRGPLARGIGARVGDRLGLPVLLYGAASAKGAGLADLRRRGYFREPRGPGPAGPARTSWPAAPWTPSTARGTCLRVRDRHDRRDAGR